METSTTTHTNDDATGTSLSSNEIRIRSNLVIKRLVDIGQNKLTEHNNITVVAKGQAISKAITVIEIIKRRHNGTLHQYNQLGKMMASAEQWQLVNDGMNTESTLPAIIIHLSSTPMPELESTTTYQPPSSST